LVTNCQSEVLPIGPSTCFRASFAYTVLINSIMDLRETRSKVMVGGHSATYFIITPMNY